jgi:hypothetical protein
MTEEIDGNEGRGFDDLDFNVTDEYKAPPLIPKGTYHATATGIKPDFSQYCIIWDWCLHDNGGVQNDGETPIDGSHVFSRNWLPKPGDKDIPTKKGNSSKHQSKVNMLMDFQESLGINMSTPQIIAESLANQAWIGVEADVDVDVEEYQGKFRNVINKVKKSSMY